MTTISACESLSSGGVDPSLSGQNATELGHALTQLYKRNVTEKITSLFRKKIETNEGNVAVCEAIQNGIFEGHECVF